MANTSFILRFGKKKGKDKGKEFPIYLRYNHKEEKILIATGRKCSLDNWISEKENSLKGKPKDTELEDRLNELKKEFNRNAVSKVEGEPEASKVREAWEKYKEDKKEKVPEAVFKNSLLARWNDYLEFQEQTLYKGRKRTNGTIRNNRNSRELLSKFLTSKKRQHIKPELFTQIDFQKYEAWLVNSPEAWRTKGKKEEAKTKAPNGVAKSLKTFKSFLKWHIKNGGRLGFNIADIEYSETAGVKIQLTEKELATIAATQFKGRLNLVRDLMVLQSSTGVRVSDLQRLCANLTEDKKAFKIKTKKKGKLVLVPVLPLAKEVLERNNYKLPHIPETKYRLGIKAIYQSLWPSKTIDIGEGDNLREVFVHEEISSHDMVRSFVNIAAKKGISIPTIATITGKSIQVLLKNYLSEDKEFAAQELLEKFDVSPLRIAN
jgi:site-specific recombinase XerD